MEPSLQEETCMEIGMLDKMILQRAFEGSPIVQNKNYEDTLIETHEENEEILKKIEEIMK